MSGQKGLTQDDSTCSSPKVFRYDHYNYCANPKCPGNGSKGGVWILKEKCELTSKGVRCPYCGKRVRTKPRHSKARRAFREFHNSSN